VTDVSLRMARNFAIIALVALVITIVPGSGSGVNAVKAAISIAFFVSIGLFVARQYREHRFTLESLPELDRGVLYASVAVALLDFAGWDRLRAAGGLGLLAGIAILGLAVLGVLWVFTRYRSYN
jgi:hypothetical protein